MGFIRDLRLARLAALRSIGWLACVLAWAEFARTEEPGVEVELVAGAPFGVGKMTVAPVDLGPPDGPLLLTDEAGRVLYPTFERTGVRVPVDRDAEPNTVTAYFLFRGKDPLKLQLRTHDAHDGTGTPDFDEDRHAQLLAAWWQRYVASAQAVAAADLYPPLIENYLLSTLARRLSLPPAELPSPTRPWNDAHDILSTLSGAESIRLAAQSRMLLASSAEAAANQPLPRPIEQPPVPLPEIDKAAQIEPIAQHVPVECFYVRCGSFANFVWLRNTLDRWGAQLRDLTSVRAVDYGIGERIGRQLALRDTALGRLLGDAVISDVAIIGNDAFLREGASIGILFEARNSAVLGQQIAAQRQQALANDKQVREQKLTLAGREVSLLATNDNSVRSFYAVDGNYHFVATSQTLVRRFLEAGQGREPLGSAPEFQWARTKLPLAQQHTVFVYLSDPFFRAMVSPQYRIEMTRRTRAAADLDVLQLAQLAATGEGRSAISVAELTADDFLPASFGRRADGSQAVAAEGTMHDSLRGAHGSFLPVPDIEVKSATQSEVNAYEAFSRMYARDWQRMDPVVIGVTRTTLDDGAKERVALDIHITPYARTHYGWLMNALGSENLEQWANVPGDVAAATISVGRDRFGIGVRDFAPSLALVDGRVRYTVPRHDQLPLYAAATRHETGPPAPWFDVTITGQPDAMGIVAGKLGLAGEVFLLAKKDLDVLAPSRPVLIEVAPHAAFVAADRPAKLRLRIGDLKSTRIAAAIQAENYLRARKISAGNVFFANALTQQLRVKQDDAIVMAGRLQGGQLLCPLGGKYELQQGFSEFGQWRSDAWPSDSLYGETQVPADYTPPLLDWFAGLLLEFNIDATSLSTHLEIDVRSK